MGFLAMHLPDRNTLMGMALGALAATSLAAIGPGYVLEAFADEMPLGFDTSRLVKFDDRYYRVEHADWVSTEPLASSTITKIEGGRVSQVNISTTATGTYSSDALTSPHVQYPGIAVEQVYPRRYGWLSYWSGGNWFRLSTYGGKSFVTLRNNGVRISTSPNRTCVSGAGFSVC